jgi:hypothetical protein
MLRQAAQAVELAGLDPPAGQALLDSIQAYLAAPGSQNVLVIEDQVHRRLRAALGGDPYVKVRKDNTRQALRLLPRLRKLLAKAGDPLETALRISAAGNAMDMAACAAYDLSEALARSLQQPFVINDLPALRADLAQAGWLLLLGDNAGETVFDRVLIEALPLPVVYAVKGGPVINDTLLEDARQAGLHRAAEVIDTGSDDVGTQLGACSAAFVERFWQAPLVIAKGQANCTTLINPQVGIPAARRAGKRAPRVYFLLRVKCTTVAAELGVPPGSDVLMRYADE